MTKKDNYTQEELKEAIRFRAEINVGAASAEKAKQAKAFPWTVRSLMSKAQKNPDYAYWAVQAYRDHCKIPLEGREADKRRLINLKKFDFKRQNQQSQNAM
ncbi:MAG: hypothetical protein ILP11_04690 [Alphaproteobacteria bacterium]|nr:hypothetical protein [Alphaproteobacteria bacterium]